MDIGHLLLALGAGLVIGFQRGVFVLARVAGLRPEDLL